MSQRTVGDGHLSPDTLADLAEGLLDARETLAARGHLVGCAQCSARQTRLGEVSRLLADSGDVGPLPPDVAGRLDDALAAEAAGTSTSDRQPDRSPFGMRVLQAAAAAVLLLAGVGIGVSALQGGGDSESAEQSTAADAGGGAAARQSAFTVTASGRNWSPDTVVEAVPELVSGAFPAAESPPAAEGGSEDSGAARPQLLSGDLGRLAGGPPLADCVTALADGPAAPLAVDLATWQGNPAAVIVLPTPDDPATVDTWIVGPGCSQADAQVLHFARVARP